jgi:site-specific DNA-methyltransferase (adenine-specific)
MVSLMDVPRSSVQQRLRLTSGVTFDPSNLFLGGDLKPCFQTGLGALFASDCMAVLGQLRPGVIDTIFADPPFNIGKKYREKTNDRLPERQYLDWCKSWLGECVRVLKPGGSLFVYNLPKWNIPLGAFLQEEGMEFRHWIAVEISACLPIVGKLHPSHYSLLYFSKGKPNTFRRIRTPISVCRHCGNEIKDYGGHRGAMNPNGVTLKDVWTDIPPVRHRKFKSAEREANALSTKLLDRVVEMSTRAGDLVLDPFGGSGTTYVVCESKGRRWIGMEIDYADDIAKRMAEGDVQPHRNTDYVEG